MDTHDLACLQHILEEELHEDVSLSLARRIFDNAGALVHRGQDKGWDDQGLRSAVIALAANSLVGHPLVLSDDDNDEQIRLILTDHIRHWKPTEDNDNEAVV